MKLTDRLIGFLNRVFQKDPQSFFALAIRYDGSSCAWSVADGVLTTTVTGGTGADLFIDLSAYTLQTLVAYINSRSGYQATLQAGSEYISLGALCLLDATGDTAQSNGGNLYGYTNVLFSIVEAHAQQLAAARDQIQNGVAQMSISSSGDEWLDILGRLYNVSRFQGEPDSLYAPRIVATVLRPRNNNVAIEAAISEALGGVGVTVTDVLSPGSGTKWDGSIKFNATALYNAGIGQQTSFGLFDVEFEIDLTESMTIDEYRARVRKIVDQLRAAGTHMRALNFTVSAMEDTVHVPTDATSNLSGAVEIVSDSVTAPTDSNLSAAGTLDIMSDAVTAPTESVSATMNWATTFNGLRTFDGSIPWNSGGSSTESL